MTHNNGEAWRAHLVSVVLVDHIRIHFAPREVNVDIRFVHRRDMRPQRCRVLDVLDALV